MGRRREARVFLPQGGSGAAAWLCQDPSTQKVGRLSLGDLGPLGADDIASSLRPSSLLDWHGRGQGGLRDRELSRPALPPSPIEASLTHCQVPRMSSHIHPPIFKLFSL